MSADLSPDHAQTADAYKECLKRILAFYDIQTDLDGVIASIPKENVFLAAEDLELVCKKLGLRFKKHKIPFQKLGALNAPAILVFKSEPCLYYPNQNDTGRFVFIGGGAADENINVRDLAQNFEKIAFIIVPEEKEGALDIEHMKQKQSQKWFWDPISKFWTDYSQVILCSFFINILALAVPLFTMNVYDRVVINFAQATLVVLTIGVALALVFDFLFKTLRTYILERIAVQTSSQYDYDLMERLINIKDVDMGLSSGEKANLFRELQGIREFYASRLVPTCVDVPFFFFFTFIIYIINPVLAIVPLMAAALIVLVNFLAQIPIHQSGAAYFTTMQNKATTLLEMLSGLQTIKTMSASGEKLLKWKLASQGAAKTAFRNHMITSSVANISFLISQIAYVCVIFLGVYQIEQNNLTIGGLIACSIIFSRSVAPVASLAGVLSHLKQSRDVLQTIDKIFQIPHEDMRACEKATKGNIKGKVEIKDLTYQYPGQTKPAIYKANLNIKAKSAIGIIGQSGAGKTTISKIITGLLSPSEGGVFLDGYACPSFAVSELHRTVGYVPQDPFFFRGSVRENILMGVVVSEEEIEKATNIAGLDLLVEQTGEGLDMDVGENGKKLSGGQKQAIAIARAVIRNPDILVFDEPTNGMDNALEERVKTSLKAYIKDKTFIMVTHRTSLLSLVDELVLMDKGRVVIHGARDEVIQKISGKADA